MLTTAGLYRVASYVFGLSALAIALWVLSGPRGGGPRGW